MANVTEAGDLAITSTSLWYLCPLPLYKNEKPFFVNFPVSEDAGVKQHNLLHEKYPDIAVRDIRGHEDTFRIDVQGFQLVHHETGLSNDDFEDDATIRAKYYPEIIKLVKKTLGASLVFPFEHTHRLHNPEVEGCGSDRKRKPLVAAHIDQTPSSSAQRVRYHMKEKAPALLKRRYQIVNVWRPLFGPLEDYPLTLGDGRTFNLERDAEPTDLVFPHYIGESTNLYHHPDHKWYFVSGQKREEAWMLKCFDSQEGVTAVAPHCSFDIQNGSYSKRPRESIEIRLLVFYDN